jgi:ubiquinone/menaquinone biosynthesis C-methylase UbiE
MHKADRVMNVAEAHRLDNPDRLQWLPPKDVLALLPLRPGAVVADIGAGTGYFALPMAHAIGIDGTLYAVDLQPEMLELLRKKLQPADAPANVVLVHGTAEATTLASRSCDVVFISNVWHELPDHAATLREFRRILLPEGVLAILDWRPDAQHPPGPPIEHRISAAEVRRTVENHGWSIEKEGLVGDYSYFLHARAV